MMNSKIKWLIHTYYFIILLFTSVALILLAPVLYFGGADWKILITIVGALFSFFYFIQKQQLDEAKFHNELFIRFNQRYDALNEKLNHLTDSKEQHKELESHEN